MRTAFGPEGDIRSTDILAALVALWRDSASGTLTFSRSGATSAFELASGEVIGASSSDPRFDTASILVRAGKLDGSTLGRLVTPEGTDRALSALQAGILTKREWRWGEKIRAVEVLSDLLTWIEGDYSFFRMGARESGDFRLTIPRLVLELFLRSRDRGLVLHHLGGVDVPLVRDARFDAEFSTFGLTDDAESVVRLIDGESTAAGIAAEAPAEAFAVEKLLAALVTLGLVHPAYAVEEAGAEAATQRIDMDSVAPAPPDEPAEEEISEEVVEALPKADEDEEELEPEVDIQDKLEAPPPPSVPEYDPLEEESPDAPEPEEALVDADLDGGDAEARQEDERETESDRLAADLRADASVPDVDVGEVGESEREAESELPPAYSAFEDQRPLDTTTGVGSLERPRHRSSLPLLAVLAVLVAATVAILLWRARGGDEPTDTSAALPSPPGMTETAVQAPAADPTEAAAPTASPAPLLATSPPAATLPPTPRPTARPAPTAAPRNTSPPRAASTPRSATAGRTVAGTAASPPKTRQGWQGRAEKDQESAAADRNARFTVQLELACEIPSLSEAFAHDRPAGSMWLVPTSYRGRSCFRVFWGRYATRDAAESGLAGAPKFFSTTRNRPMVVAIPEAR